jgi:hypothetical protein
LRTESRDFSATLTHPNAIQRLREIFHRGIQQRSDVEYRLGHQISTL